MKILKSCLILAFVSPAFAISQEEMRKIFANNNSVWTHELSEKIAPILYTEVNLKFFLD